jgi:hypothetical protein
MCPLICTGVVHAWQKDMPVHACHAHALRRLRNVRPLSLKRAGRYQDGKKIWCSSPANSHRCSTPPDLLSVLGLVPTLTSEIRCDQPLDGRRKWQHKDTSLSWFRPEGRMSSRLRMCTVLPCSKGACRGGLPARWDRRRSLQVPAMMIEAKCQYQVM